MDTSNIVINILYETYVKQYYKMAIAAFVGWLFYLVIKVNSFIDVVWCLIHLMIGGFLFAKTQNNIVYLILLAVWCLRLGGYLFVTRVLKGHSDKRYELLAEKRARGNQTRYMFFSFQLQALLMTFTSLPLYFVFVNETRVWTHYLGILLVVYGIVFETIADVQLYLFQTKHSIVTKGDNDKKIYTGGLWEKARHPNLFFELITWCGFAMGGVDPKKFITFFGFVGPLILYLIMKNLTVPLTEASMKKTRPNWEEHVKKTTTFFPF